MKNNLEVCQSLFFKKETLAQVFSCEYTCTSMKNNLEVYSGPCHISMKEL